MTDVDDEDVVHKKSHLSNAWPNSAVWAKYLLEKHIEFVNTKFIALNRNICRGRIDKRCPKAVAKSWTV